MSRSSALSALQKILRLTTAWDCLFLDVVAWSLAKVKGTEFEVFLALTSWVSCSKQLGLFELRFHYL